ncbi:uncharacterized protein LOC129723979 [Wyeomyia smithii]|uniref:uncharacterized protein LOC129723979 n=1 Tax=Wyeomyia smithii TaxID=174621 RepID=UPI002467C56A|nr:uncharacterized protein LOC129723979 [Wyeomyia smithii]
MQPFATQCRVEVRQIKSRVNRFSFELFTLISLFVVLFKMMKILVGLALIGMAASECRVPIKHYKTMNCNAIGGIVSECPTRFDCPSITQHDKSKCYFNGKTYELSAQIPNELVTPFCSAQCYCRSASPFAQFRCVHVDCAEFFSAINYDDCIRTYKPNSCCSSGTVCGKERKKLAKCVVNGDEYLAGQRMYPSSNKCLTCICHEGFSEANITSDPNCYEPTCGFELFYAKQAYNGGIPVYRDNKCCPWEWRMPKDTDKLVEKSGSRLSSDPALQCKYGKLAMNIGDTLVSEESNGFTYTCTCAIPPLAQCVMSKNAPL